MGRASFFRGVAAISMMLGMSPPVVAQSETPTVQSETERLKAEAALERARADRDKAAAERITALGLPNFEGKTTLGTGVGSMEATMLASHALRAAADKIRDATDPKPKEGQLTTPIIVLAGDEALDFGRIGALDTEMDSINVLFDALLQDKNISPEAGGSVSAIIGAATAAAGLLRSDTEVTALDLQALSNRVLATAVAARLGKHALLPSAAIGSLEAEAPQANWKKMSLMQKLNALTAKRRAVADKRPKLPEKPSKPEQEKDAQFATALTRFDAFFARATTADDKGVVSIVAAARLDAMRRKHPRILRVFVEKAGGSMINTKNLLTTLGVADPVRITGGLVASYLLTDPTTGGVLASDVLSCRTTISRLRTVQRGFWPGDDSGADEGAHCTGLS